MKLNSPGLASTGTQGHAMNVLTFGIVVDQGAIASHVARLADFAALALGRLGQARRVERGDTAKFQRGESLRKFVEGHEETAVRAQRFASGTHGGTQDRCLVRCFEQGGAQGEAGLQKAGELGFSHGKQAWGRLERVQVGDHLPDLFLAQHACPTHHGCPRLAFADAPEQVIISHLGADRRAGWQERGSNAWRRGTIAPAGRAVTGFAVTDVIQRAIGGGFGAKGIGLTGIICGNGGNETAGAALAPQAERVRTSNKAIIKNGWFFNFSSTKFSHFGHHVGIIPPDLGQFFGQLSQNESAKINGMQAPRKIISKPQPF